MILELDEQSRQALLESSKKQQRLKAERHHNKECKRPAVVNTKKQGN